jgi:integrase
MATGKLSARFVSSAPPGTHSDGGNLYLRVRPSGSRSWVYRFRVDGKVRELGLGPTHARSLADARTLAAAMRSAVLNGRDPAQVLARSSGDGDKPKTFADCAAELIEAKRPGWRNAKHAQQWQNTLRDHVLPVIGDKLPADIGIAHVKAILLPLWATKTETATRVRQRIEAVIDYASVHGLCDGPNPARWKGCLDKVLPPPRKVTRVEHHAAAPYAEVPRIMAELARKDHVSALALRFIILTACRSGEARAATWAEIDLPASVWTVPSTRMKAGREHRVPLSDAAMTVLAQAQALRRVSTDLIFPGARDGVLSDVATNKTLHAIAPGVTVHGFRSSFRVWCEEQTSFPSSVTEAALAHVNRDRVEAAYQRSDLFDRRRELMQAWSDFLEELRDGEKKER